MLHEGGLALLETDRVHDPLALDAFQAGFDNRPLRRVDHDRDAGDVGLRGNQAEKGGHRVFGIEHRVVHVDVDHLRAVRHLLLGDLESGLEIAFQDQLLEAGGAGDVRALADIDEAGDRIERERLISAEPAGRLDDRHLPRRHALNRLRNRRDVLGRGAAAAAYEVDEPAFREFTQFAGHIVGRFVVSAEGVGQPGIGMNADVYAGDP